MELQDPIAKVHSLYVLVILIQFNKCVLKSILLYYIVIFLGNFLVTTAPNISFQCMKFEDCQTGLSSTITVAIII